MTKPKFTPGPWSRNIPPASHYPTIFAGRNTHIAVVQSSGLSPAEVEANCDLIKSAPDLFEALTLARAVIQTALDAHQVSERNVRSTLDEINRVLTRATGKSA